ncbi:hypothetical protein JF66_12515 [Cryobacterium sp. MLB-32]|nr:hypothetical protein JF66_12515 [Cryobacterium sp. MLB-32]
MNGDPVFDPRHDAVFQRGYEAGTTPRTGTASPDAASPVAQTPAAASASSTAPVAPTAADTLRQSLAALNDAERPAPPLAELTDTQLHETTVHDAAGITPKKRSLPNPFIIGLWVLGPALIWGGGWLAVRATSTFSSGGTNYNSDEVPWDVLYAQFFYTISPTLVTAGITTILGLLFWHAWTWRAARR